MSGENANHGFILKKIKRVMELIMALTLR